MAKFGLESAVCNDKGLIRSNNEDSYYLNGRFMPLAMMDEGGTDSILCADPLQLYAVCDGMGGEAAGEQASYQAVEELRIYQDSLGTSVSNDSVNCFVERVSGSIYQRAQASGNRSGCTLTLCVWEQGVVRAVHVGDSRIYQLHDGRLNQLTLDHSEVQRMVGMGVITQEEARRHPKRHMITQYLGMSSEDARIEATITKPIACSKGDLFLLCSDGLTDMVEDADLLRILTKAVSAKSAAVSLVQMALRKGGRDNVTAMCIKVRKYGIFSRFNLFQKALLWSSALFVALALLFLAEYLFCVL